MDGCIQAGIVFVVLFVSFLVFQFYMSVPYVYESDDEVQPARLPRGRVSMSNLTFTFYSLSTCGWCKRVMPEWEKLLRAYRGPIRLRNVEAHDSPEEVEAAGVTRFPTFLLSNDDTREYLIYKGERTSEDFLEFLMSFS